MRAYNLRLHESFFEKVKFEKTRYDFLENNQRNIRQNLSHLVNEEGVIKAKDVQDKWFRHKKIDVFISHSHRDKDMAIDFAKWLHDKFKLISFVDSSIWGHSKDLIKQIDDKYSNKRTQSDGTALYDHVKAQNATTHVNMILSGALLKMINSSEVVIFLNSPNSISSPSESVKTETYSPWIYLELLYTSFKIKTLKALDEQTKFIKDEQPEFRVSFDIDTSHLIDINQKKLEEWNAKYYIQRVANKNEKPLDVLKEITKGF